MEPYYERGNVRLYLGDCQDVMATLSRHTYDLMATDPPYGVRWRSNRRTRRVNEMAGDQSTEAAERGLEMGLRLLKPYRHFYVFGRFSLEGLPITDTAELIWDKQKPGMGNLSLPWGQEHEYIQFGTYTPSKSNAAKGYGRLSARLRQGSVIQCPNPNNGVAKFRHTTQKPVDLMRQLIESSTVLGETVLDQFAGSGTTLVAAILEGRGAVGIEIDERHAEEAANRCDRALMLVAQLTGL